MNRAALKVPRDHEFRRIINLKANEVVKGKQQTVTGITANGLVCFCQVVADTIRRDSWVRETLVLDGMRRRAG